MAYWVLLLGVSYKATVRVLVRAMVSYDSSTGSGSNGKLTDIAFGGIQSHIGSWPEDLRSSVANSQASLSLLLCGPQKVSHNMVANFHQSKEDNN